MSSGQTATVASDRLEAVGIVPQHVAAKELALERFEGTG